MRDWRELSPEQQASELRVVWAFVCGPAVGLAVFTLLGLLRWGWIGGVLLLFASLPIVSLSRLVLGVPLFMMLRRRLRPSPWSAMSVGAGLALLYPLAGAAITFYLNAKMAPQDGGVLASYFGQVALSGLLGGLAFWWAGRPWPFPGRWRSFD